MASWFGSSNRLKSTVSSKTATCGLELFNVVFNVAEKVAGAPPDGFGSLIISAVRGNGAAAVAVGVAIININQIIMKQHAAQAREVPMLQANIAPLPGRPASRQRA